MATQIFARETLPYGGDFTWYVIAGMFLESGRGDRKQAHLQPSGTQIRLIQITESLSNLL